MGLKEKNEALAQAREDFLRETEVKLKQDSIIPTGFYDLKTQVYAGLFGSNKVFAIFFRGYIDTNSKMLVFADTETRKIQYLDYTKITGYNVIQIKKGSSGNSSSIGYNVGNGLGIGSTSTQINDYYSKIGFMFTLDDINIPSCDVAIYENFQHPVYSNAQYYTDIMNFVETFKPVLDNIVKTNQTEKKEDAISAADELKKFKELLDMGVITKEEFDIKKKQLLRL